jgi:hypothetical protein
VDQAARNDLGAVFVVGFETRDDGNADSKKRNTVEVVQIVSASSSFHSPSSQSSHASCFCAVCVLHDVSLHCMQAVVAGAGAGDVSGAPYCRGGGEGWGVRGKKGGEGASAAPKCEAGSTRTVQISSVEIYPTRINHFQVRTVL